MGCSDDSVFTECFIKISKNIKFLKYFYNISKTFLKVSNRFLNLEIDFRNLCEISKTLHESCLTCGLNIKILINSS